MTHEEGNTLIHGTDCESTPFKSPSVATVISHNTLPAYSLFFKRYKIILTTSELRVFYILHVGGNS